MSQDPSDVERQSAPSLRGLPVACSLLLLAACSESSHKPAAPPPSPTAVEPVAPDLEPETEPVTVTMQGGLPHYRFDEPDFRWDLPEELMEVSGIALTGPSELACVEDERGSLYRFDLDGDDDDTRTKFGRKGDYEGLARAGDRLLVLRSDGALLPIDFDGKALGKFTNPFEDIPFEEFESVAFEAAKERWLVLPKDATSDDEWTKDDRVIYALGLDDLALAVEPALVLSRKEVIKAAAERDWPLPTRVSKKGKEKPDFDFRPSDLAVHPLTGDYFILSGRDRTLLAVSPAGELLGTAVFPASVLVQPEGLAFQPGGTLLIASEGLSGEDREIPGAVLRFPFHPN